MKIRSVSSTRHQQVFSNNITRMPIKKIRVCFAMNALFVWFTVKAKLQWQIMNKSNPVVPWTKLTTCWRGFQYHLLVYRCAKFALTALQFLHGGLYCWIKTECVLHIQLRSVRNTESKYICAMKKQWHFIGARVTISMAFDVLVFISLIHAKVGVYSSNIILSLIYRILPRCYSWHSAISINHALQCKIWLAFNLYGQNFFGEKSVCICILLKLRTRLKTVTWNIMTYFFSIGKFNFSRWQVNTGKPNLITLCVKVNRKKKYFQCNNCSIVPVPEKSPSMIWVNSVSTQP